MKGFTNFKATKVLQTDKGKINLSNARAILIYDSKKALLESEPGTNPAHIKSIEIKVD